MRPLAILVCAAALFGPAASPASGDTTSPGYFISSERAIPLYASFATETGGGVVLFDGRRVSLLVPPAREVGYLGRLPAFVYPSFVLLHPTEGTVLIGESSNGRLLEIGWGDEDFTVLAQIPLNFDAVWEDAGHLLVSAAPCGFPCGNRILRVDAGSGAQEIVAQLTGPSGPLARSADGHLYYGVQPTAYPPPPGSMRVVRWTAAQVRSGSVLSEADGTVLVTGLDGAASIDVDPLYGDLWVANSRFPGGSEVLRFRDDGTFVAAVVDSPDWIANLEVTRTESGAPLRTFPPSTRLRLRYARVDYNPGGGASLVTVGALGSPVPPAGL